jgi:D-beta-D-heptose 7-phosphate kinase/D-beta-D-heptose 1-phosphate adenosyltransferase
MNPAQRLVEEVNKVQKHIVIIGDVMTDVWVHGRLEACQDDCIKFMEESRSYVPGGAANAARSLDHWRIKKTLIGRAQNDCPIKIRFVDSKSRSGVSPIVFRHDNETSLEPDDYWWLHAEAVEKALLCDAVLLSDYDKGFLTPRLIRGVIGVCQDRGIPCVVDCKREPELYRGSTMKVNEDYSSRYPKWWERHDYRYVQTFGNRSPVYRPSCQYNDTYAFGNPLSSVDCVNHVGAGDCFAAHLTLALAYGYSLEDAAVIAHSAGRVYVQYPHNRPPHPSEITADMDPDAIRIRITTVASESADGREPV